MNNERIHIQVLVCTVAWFVHLARIFFKQRGYDVCEQHHHFVLITVSGILVLTYHSQFLLASIMFDHVGRRM